MRSERGAEHRHHQAEGALDRDDREHTDRATQHAVVRDPRGVVPGAIEAYEQYLSTPWLFRYEVDAYELEPALQRLAELYDARGERPRALETRTRLLALWRRADAELQPVLADVRTPSRSLTDEREPKREAPWEVPRPSAR
jgi:hypothetical protein